MIMDRKEQSIKAAEQYKLAVIDNADLHINYEEDNYDAGIMYAINEVTEKSFNAGVIWADEHPKNPWISVKDRLPEPEEEILLYDRDSVKHYVIGWLCKKKGYNKAKWVVTNVYVADESITHWMPIVAPK